MLVSLIRKKEEVEIRLVGNWQLAQYPQSRLDGLYQCE
jgi:hypothetical protein